MNESEHTTADTSAAAGDRNSRLYRALAWVGIVAGTLFIVMAVFFSGFVAGRNADGDGWRRGYHGGQIQPGGPMGGGCPMMQMGQGSPAMPMPPMAGQR